MVARCSWPITTIRLHLSQAGFSRKKRQAQWYRLLPRDRARAILSTKRPHPYWRNLFRIGNGSCRFPLQVRMVQMRIGECASCRIHPPNRLARH